MILIHLSARDVHAFSSDRDPWREERRGMASADDARGVWQHSYESDAGLYDWCKYL